MTKVTVSAPAKINLTLNIEGRRNDGYHCLSSVFQAISLADCVEIEKIANSGIVLSLSDPKLPCDERNTAYRAAQVFFEHTGCEPHVHIHVTKIIPQQAGLGGGSADAAGVLVGLNALYDAGLSTKELCVLGEKVGADVPFCIVGGTAMVTGIGEVIEPMSPLPHCFIVVAKPDVGVSTAQAYTAVDGVKTVPADQAAMRKAIEDGDLQAVGAQLSNAFEQALELPQVEKVLRAMRGAEPLGCMMSGSGSAVFALCDTQESMVRVVDSLPADVQHYCCVRSTKGAHVITEG